MSRPCSGSGKPVAGLRGTKSWGEKSFTYRCPVCNRGVKPTTKGVLKQHVRYN